MNITCLNCGWVHFTRKESLKEINCECWKYKGQKFRKSKDDDCPRGVTLTCADISGLEKLVEANENG